MDFTESDINIGSIKVAVVSVTRVGSDITLCKSFKSMQLERWWQFGVERSSLRSSSMTRFLLTSNPISIDILRLS